MLVPDLATIRNEIPTMQIAIIQGMRIGPPVLRQIGMRKVDATIDHGNDRCCRTRYCLPCGSYVDIRAVLPSILACISQCPLNIYLRIVGPQLLLGNQKVWFGKFDLRIKNQLERRCPDIAPSRQFQFIDTGSASKLPLPTRAVCHEDHVFDVLGNSSPKSNE